VVDEDGACAALCTKRSKPSAPSCDDDAEGGSPSGAIVSKEFLTCVFNQIQT
jgi:hypothetical protein